MAITRRLSRTFRGKHVYVFDGVMYLKKKEAVESVCSFLKQSNGRYYVSLENYQLGRKLFWKRKFISSVRQLIMKKKENMIAWRNTVAGAKHRQRCEQLISQLRGRLQVKQSKLYTDIRLKLTCPYCITLSLKYACGPCECHLCEDWLGCGSQTKCRDLLKCSSCFFSKDIARRRFRRFPYRYLWE